VWTVGRSRAVLCSGQEKLVRGEEIDEGVAGGFVSKKRGRGNGGGGS
jgi:hypothetical protein